MIECFALGALVAIVFMLWEAYKRIWKCEGKVRHLEERAYRLKSTLETYLEHEKKQETCFFCGHVGHASEFEPPEWYYPLQGIVNAVHVVCPVCFQYQTRARVLEDKESRCY